jgi:hypothetical protein
MACISGLRIPKIAVAEKKIQFFTISSEIEKLGFTHLMPPILPRNTRRIKKPKQRRKLTLFLSFDRG